MVTAVAHIPSDRPERYLRQLCDHAAAMGRGGHASHAGHGPGAAGVEVTAESSDASGTITFTTWGTCRLTADDGLLTLRVEALDAEGMRRIQEVLTRDLDRFGRRDGVVVSWEG